MLAIPVYHGSTPTPPEASQGPAMFVAWAAPPHNAQALHSGDSLWEALGGPPSHAPTTCEQLGHSTPPRPPRSGPLLRTGCTFHWLTVKKPHSWDCGGCAQQPPGPQEKPAAEPGFTLLSTLSCSSGVQVHPQPRRPPLTHPSCHLHLYLPGPPPRDRQWPSGEHPVV